MKVGIVGGLDYPKLNVVQCYVDYLQAKYRPFGNLDDEWEEPITILSYLKSNLDCVAVVAAAKANFKVELVDDAEAMVKKANKIYAYWDGNCKHTKEVIDLALRNHIHVEIIFPTGGK